MIRGLIVSISILLFFASLSCQTYTTTLVESPGRVDEAATTSTLHLIARAQIAYSASHGDDYGTFEQLSEGGYLDPRFNSSKPVLYGYTFTMIATPKSADSAGAFHCNADPVSVVNAKARHFYVDSSSPEIHTNTTTTANANDETIKP